MEAQEGQSQGEAWRPGIFNLKEMKVEHAVLLFAAIADASEASGVSGGRDDPFEVMIDEFSVEEEALVVTDLPKAIELNTAMAKSPNSACRLEVAQGINNLARRAPREGLMIWLGLLADPDERVVMAAYDGLDPPGLSDNFLKEGPPIEARIIYSILERAHELFRAVRAEYEDR